MDRQRQIPEQHRQLNKACLNCPRCNSTNTKFCYYNNYSLSQPRHFCKACKRYWTRGGTLRNVPVGGGCRKNNNKQRVNKRPTSSSSSSPNNPQPSSANQASQIVTGPNNNNCTLLAPLFYGLAGHVNSSGYEQGLIQQKQSSYDSDVNSTKEMILTDPFLSDYYSNNNINPISLFLPPPSSFLVQDKQGAGDAVVQDTSNQQGHQLIQGLIPFQQQQQQKQEDHPQEQRWDSKQIISDLLGHSSSSVYWTGERNVVSSWPPI